MNRASAVALVTGVFLAGIAVGAIGAQIVLWRSGPRGFGSHGEMGKDFRGRSSFAERMQKDLDLSDDQKAKIETIQQESAAEANALRATFHPQFQALMDRTTKRIDEVLSPEQRAKFKSLLEERRFGAHRFFFGPAPMPPWSGGGSGPEHFERRFPPGGGQPDGSQPAPGAEGYSPL